MRATLRKLKKVSDLSFFEVWHLIHGSSLFDGETDTQELKKKWPKIKDRFMSWWLSDQLEPEFCPKFNRMPPEKRHGARPQFWWNDEGLKRKKISGSADGYDGNLYGIPGGFLHLHSDHIYESELAYLKRTNQLAECEKDLNLPMTEKVP